MTELPSPKRSRYSQWGINIGFALVSLAVSLLIANYIYGKFEPWDQAQIVRNHLQFLQYDPVTGWRNRPGEEGIIETSSFTNRVRINQDGMRYQEVDPKKQFRIALIGDSIPFGYGVEEKDRFSNVAAQHLNTEILNFSVIGYNLLEYYLSLHRMLSFQPDMIIFTFTLNNDFNNSSNITSITQGYAPYAKVMDGKLNIKGYPIPDYTMYNKFRHNKLGNFFKRYALGRLLYVTLRERTPVLFNKWFTDKVPPAPSVQGMKNFKNEWIYDEPDRPEVKEVMDEDEAILKATKDELDENHVALAIFAIRTRIDTNGNAIDQLRRMTTKLGIPLIYNAASYNNDQWSYKDEHWTALGHRQGASVLETYISDYLKKTGAK